MVEFGHVCSLVSRCSALRQPDTWLPTMASADFCTVTPTVASGRAARLIVRRCRFLRSWRAARHGSWSLVARWDRPGHRHDQAGRRQHRPPQVRTRTVGAQAPHLPWPAYRWASLSCASSPRLPRPSMRFLSVASHLLHSGFLQTIPHGLALAFGSWLYSVHNESKSVLPQGTCTP